MMFDMAEMILPSPDASFEWRPTPFGPSLSCVPLARHAAHLFTTRHWALGSSLRSVDDPAAWLEVASAAGVPPDRLVRLRQVHGAAIREARPRMALGPVVGGALNVTCDVTRNVTLDTVLDEADILISDDPSLALAIQAADCLPLLIADPTTGAVAAAHAGWRGLAARVPQVTVEALAKRYGSQPRHLIAATGPSIGGCCYDVGEDVRAAFETAGFGSALRRWFLAAPCPTVRNASMAAVRPTRRADHWFFDGWSAVVEQLHDAGVRPTHIFSARMCTASHPSTLCSYRRDGAPAGRLAGVIRPGVRRR